MRMSPGDDPSSLSPSPPFSLNLTNSKPSTRLPVAAGELVQVPVPENPEKLENPDAEHPIAIDMVDGANMPAEMTVAPKDSEMQDTNTLNGNVMESSKTNEQTNEDLCPQGSPNRAIFEFKHQDTDVEESPQLKRKNTSEPTENKFNKIVEDETPSNHVIRGARSSNANLNLSQYGRRGQRRWSQEADEEYDSDGLQRIIDSSIMEPNWLKVESDGLDQSCEEASDEPPALETMDTGSEEGATHQPRPRVVVTPTKLNSSYHQLLNAAEHLVKATPLPSPIVSPRVPLSFGGTRSRVPPKSLSLVQVGLHNESEMKQQRIQKWLATQRQPPTLDSCDASGEMTTGESDGGSSSDSADCTLTSKLAKDLPQSLVCTPVAADNSPVGLIGSEPSKVSY